MRSVAMVAMLMLGCGPMEPVNDDDLDGGGPRADAGLGHDAGERDAGSAVNDSGASPDGGVDAGTEDAGSFIADAGLMDAGLIDGGLDAGWD
jgi:hypothetical protein